MYAFVSDIRIQNTNTSNVITKQCIELYKDRHINYLNKFNILFFPVFHDTIKLISEQSNTVLNTYVPSYFTFDSNEHSKLLHRLFTLFFMYLLNADDVKIYNNWQDCLEKYTNYSNITEMVFRENLWKKMNSDRFKHWYYNFVIKMFLNKDELPLNTFETLNNQYDTLTRDSCESLFINRVDNYLNPIVYNQIFNTQESNKTNSNNNESENNNVYTIITSQQIQEKKKYK